MVRKKNDMAPLVRDSIRGGIGPISTDVAFTPEEMIGKATLFSRMTIMPGKTIGEHAHTEDAEIYYILEGEVVANDNGTEVIMTAGDAMFTGGGATHAVENKSDKPAMLLAIVIA